MRKLGASNIKSFIIFSIIVLFVIAIFSYGIVKVLSHDKSIYKTKANDYIYDEEYNPINLNSEGVISQSWDGKYYLKTDIKKYSLGLEAIVYNPNNYIMYAYGNIYQIFEDGMISKKSGQTEITKNTSASFYKLADRKYLVIDKEMVDTNKDFFAKNYLIVVLDKQGNALLLNNEINLKTINSLVLKSSNFVFDVANEKLEFNGKQIDLKKVIGSTNEFVKLEKQSDTSVENSEDNLNIGDEAYSKGGSTEPLKFQKRISLRNLIPSITYIDVEYSVVDPINEYDSVFLLLSDGTNTNKFQLNKNEISYKIRNLNPNSEYTLSIGCSYIDKNNSNSVVEEMQDVVTVRTTKPNYNLMITKVSNDKIYFNLKLDPLYKLESGFVVLYSDNVKIKSANIDVITSTLAGGWDYYISIPNPGYEIILKLENTIYNGNIIETNVKAMYINY